jgi:hypothetical protein
LPDITDEEIARVPKLLNAPPLPEVKFAPEEVTPEMNRLPREFILKMLKLPLLPLIVSEEAPRPLMMTLPAKLPLISVVVLIIFGSEEVREMV